MIVTAFDTAVEVAPLVASREPLSPARAARRAEILLNLCQPTIVPEDAHSLEDWQLGTFNAFKPRNAWEDWLGQMASVMMFRISRAERIERRLRDLQALRAIDFWEEDQKLAAEETAAKLVEEPGRTYANLWSTPAGCDWLIARWEELAAVPAEQWTAAQRIFVRLICPVRDAETLKPGFATQRIASMKEQRERTLDQDRALRALVEADISDEVSKPLARLRRYRNSLRRELKWFVDQLRVEQPEHRLDHRYRPEYERRLAEPYPPRLPGSAAAAGSEATLLQPNHEIDETKPSADLAGEPTPPDEPSTRIETAQEPETPVRESFTARIETAMAGRVEERQRRIDPARAVARQRKAARQRSA